MGKSKNCIIGFCAILFLFSAIPCQAQSLSLSLWPPLLEVMIQPGKTITYAYQLTNNSDHELTIVPQIVSFEATGEQGQIKLNFPSKSLPSKPLTTNLYPLTFSFESGEVFGKPVTIAIGQSKQVILKIFVPERTPEKDYYHTLLFSTGQEIEPQGSSTSSITQIGTNILLTVSKTGKPPYLGRILEFSSLKVVDSFSPVQFTVRLENWGKTLWKPFGKIKIEGILEQNDEVKLWEQNILAYSARKLDVPAYRPKLPIGPFKALLDLTVNENGERLYTEINFWYLPYKAFLGTAAVLIFWLIGKKIISKRHF